MSKRIGPQQQLACRKRLLNGTQKSGGGAGRFAHRTTWLFVPGGGMEYPWHATYWFCQAMIRKTWAQTEIYHVPCTLKNPAVVFYRSRNLWLRHSRLNCPILSTSPYFQWQSKPVDPSVLVSYPIFYFIVISCSFYHRLDMSRVIFLLSILKFISM